MAPKVGKRKWPTKHGFGNRQAELPPKTPDERFEELLEEADGHEEKAERWSQDSQKSLRFYERAIASYRQSLEIRPRDVETLYNLGRLFYATMEKCDLEESARVGAIETSIEYFRQAIASSPSELASIDLNFNLVQSLVQLVDVVVNSEQEDGPQSVLLESHGGAVSVCREAITLASNTWQQQESRFAGRDDGDNNSDQIGPATQGCANGSHYGQEAKPEPLANGNSAPFWVEDVGPSQIIATLEAIMEGYCTLCSALRYPSSGNVPEQDETFFTDIRNMVHGPIQNRAAQLVSCEEDSERLELASLRVRISEGELRLAKSATDIKEWLIELRTTQAGMRPVFSQATVHAECLCEVADAYRDAVTSAASSADRQLESMTQTELWELYSTIAQLYAQAAKNDPGQVNIWISRGDVELERASIAVPAAQHNAGRLRSNANVYFREAKGRMKQHGTRLERDCEVKIAMTSA